MKSAVLILAMAGTAAAEPLPDVVAHKLVLPDTLGVAHVFAPADDVDVNKVNIEAIASPRVGRVSVKVTIGKKSQYVQVAIAPMVDVHVATRALAAGATIAAADVAVERHATDERDANVVGATLKHDVAAGDAIAARDVTMPAPIARGTVVRIAIHRSGLVIRGSATLEAAAHVGEATSARLSATHTIVRGTLVAADQLEVAP